MILRLYRTVAKGQLKSGGYAGRKTVELAAKRIYSSATLTWRVIHIWSAHRFWKTAPWILKKSEDRGYHEFNLVERILIWIVEPDAFARASPEPEMKILHLFQKYLELANQVDFIWNPLSGSREAATSKSNSLRCKIQSKLTWWDSSLASNSVG